MIKKFCLLLSAFCLPALAQNQYTPIDQLPLGDVFLSLPTSHMPVHGTWEVRFTHRFNQSIDQGSFSDRVHTLFGLDSNADVGIGLSYVPVRDLQLSFYRSNAMDDIELAAKYNIFQQARAIPFSAAIWKRDGPGFTSMTSPRPTGWRRRRTNAWSTARYSTSSMNTGRAVSTLCAGAWTQQAIRATSDLRGLLRATTSACGSTRTPTARPAKRASVSAGRQDTTASSRRRIGFFAHGRWHRRCPTEPRRASEVTPALICRIPRIISSGNGRYSADAARARIWA